VKNEAAIVRIGGKEYLLVYDFNSICDAESVAGCNLLDAIQHMGGMSAVEFRGLLYAALKPNHPEMTIGAAGDLFSCVTQLPDWTRGLAEAYSLSVKSQVIEAVENAAKE